MYDKKKLMKLHTIKTYEKKKKTSCEILQTYIDDVVSPHVFECVAWCRPPGDPAM